RGDGRAAAGAEADVELRPRALRRRADGLDLVGELCRARGDGRVEELLLTRSAEVRELAAGAQAPPDLVDGAAGVGGIRTLPADLERAVLADLSGELVRLAELADGSGDRRRRDLREPVDAVADEPRLGADLIDDRRPRR